MANEWVGGLLHLFSLGAEEKGELTAGSIQCIDVKNSDS